MIFSDNRINKFFFGIFLSFFLYPVKIACFYITEVTKNSNITEISIADLKSYILNIQQQETEKTFESCCSRAVNRSTILFRSFCIFPLCFRSFTFVQRHCVIFVSFSLFFKFFFIDLISRVTLDVPVRFQK